MPPRTKHGAPGAAGLRAASSSSVATVPAERGPRLVPNTPRAAMAARRMSVSNQSSVRSATGIGAMRSRRYASGARRARGSGGRSSAGATAREALGRSRDGGISRARSASSDAPWAISAPWNAGNRAASRGENRAMWRRCASEATRETARAHGRPRRARSWRRRARSPRRLCAPAQDRRRHPAAADRTHAPASARGSRGASRS